MEEAMGVMKVTRDTRPVASHRRLNDQHLGLLGSFLPFHVTCTQMLAGIPQLATLELY